MRLLLALALVTAGFTSAQDDPGVTGSPEWGPKINRQNLLDPISGK